MLETGPPPLDLRGHGELSEYTRAAMPGLAGPSPAWPSPACPDPAWPGPASKVAYNGFRMLLIYSSPCSSITRRSKEFTQKLLDALAAGY